MTNTKKGFNSTIIPIKGNATAMRILPNMLTVLSTVALFSDSICLLIPFTNIRFLDLPNPLINRRKMMPNNGNVAKPNKIKENPIIKSTTIKNNNLFFTLFNIQGIRMVNIIFTMFINAAMKPNHKIGMLTSPKYT